MKIEIKNFGPIREFVFDLDKDLHLIYGENSIGKSYAVYVVYGLIKLFNNKSEGNYSIDEYIEQEIQKNITKLDSTNKKRIDITSVVKDVFNTYFEQVFSLNLKNTLHNTFSSYSNLNNDFSKGNFEISFFFDEEKHVRFFYEKEKLAFISHFILEKHELVKVNVDEYEYHVNAENIIGGSIGKTHLSFMLKGFMQRGFYTPLKEINNKFDNIYFLPASRSGLYQSLSSFTPMLAELSKNRFYLKNNKIELPSLPEPVSDYFLDLSSINKKDVNKDFLGIIEKMEVDLLKGKVFFDAKNKKIRYQPEKTNLEFDLSEASSMVSEIAPIILFLKHIIKENKSEFERLSKSVSARLRRAKTYEATRERLSKKYRQNILIIEEPEAHLHPKLQLKLMQFFAELTKLNIKSTIGVITLNRHDFK